MAFPSSCTRDGPSAAWRFFYNNSGMTCNGPAHQQPPQPLGMGSGAAAMGRGIRCNSWGLLVYRYIGTYKARAQRYRKTVIAYSPSAMRFSLATTVLLAAASTVSATELVSSRKLQSHISTQSCAP